MKLLIAVPSKSRPIECFKNSYKLLKKYKQDFKIFVSLEDYRSYVLAGMEEHLVKVPNQYRGLCQTLLFIQKYATENEYDLIWKFDDDMKDLSATDKITQPYVFADTIYDCIKAFEEDPKLAAIEIPRKQTLWWYKRGKFLTKNYKLLGNYLIRTELYRINPDLKLYEDIYATLKLLSEGYKTLMYGDSAIVTQSSGIMRGGLQDLADRNKATMEAMEIIQKEFPQTKIVQKKSKSANWSWELDLKDCDFYKPEKL